MALDETPNPLLDNPEAARRMDEWANMLTGVGHNGRTRFTFGKPVRITDQQLDDLYYGDPYAARVCDCVPEEALRRGFKFRCDYSDQSESRAMNSGSNSKQGDELKAAAALHRVFDTHHLPMKVREAWTWGRVWGGGFLLLGINDGHPVNEPLDLKAAKQFLFAASCDKTELYPIQWYSNPERANFGEPEIYQLTRQAGITVDARQIHATRVIRFDGAMTVRRRRLQNNSWSESILQRVHGSLEQFNGAYAAVSTLMQEASLRTVGIKNLAQMMAADSGNLLKQRLSVMDQMTSVARAVLYDKDLESVTRTEVGALSGLADMLRMYVLFLAGAYHIPVTVLMGQAPAGLNATGDSDVRLFYDRIDCDRTNYLKPRLIRLATILCACDDGPTGGTVPRIDVTFPSMYASTPAEEADIKLKTAQTDAVYLTNQVVTPEEIATSRFPATGWSTDTTIELEARDLTKAANETGEQDPPGTAPAKAIEKDAAAMPAILTTSQTDRAMQIVERVGARTISREAGAAMLAALGFAPAQADSILGETGRSHFTTPEPSLQREHEDLKTALARLQRSHDSRGRMLQRVLSENKAGRLVTGSPVGIGSRDDETDEDVASGEGEESQARPMPEGPPYTSPAVRAQQEHDREKAGVK